MSNTNWQILVGTKVDTSGIQKQLDTMTKKSVTITPTIKGTKTVTQYADTMGNIVSTTKEWNKATGETETTISKASTKVNTMSDSINKANKGAFGLGQSFASITKKVVAFGAVTSIIGTFTTLMYSAVEAVKDFDDAMTEFKKVSTFDDSQLDSYTDKLS